MAPAIIALLIAGACDPPRSVTLANGLRTSIITRDGGDTYTITSTSGNGVDAKSPAGNRSRNLRMAIIEPDAPVSIDQESCTTWFGPMNEQSQPGVVLRARTDDHHTRLIMVTNNVWAGIRSVVNVHLIDSEVWPESYQQIGGRAVGTLAPHPLPWRFCARAVGDVVTFKGWSTSLPEPDWNDPDQVGQVTLPADFVHAGRPGVYAGHVPPGRISRYRANTKHALTGGVGEERWNTLLTWAAELQVRADTLAAGPLPPLHDPTIEDLAMRTSLGEANDAAERAAASPGGRLASGRHVFARVLGRPGGTALSGSAATRAATLMLSAEFTKGTSTDAQWVTRVFERLLGRSPDAASLDFWAGRVAGTSRRTVATQLWNSAEHAGRSAALLFEAAFGRPPSPAERQRATALVQSADFDASRSIALIFADTAPVF